MQPKNRSHGEENPKACVDSSFKGLIESQQCRIGGGIEKKIHNRLVYYKLVEFKNERKKRKGELQKQKELFLSLSLILRTVYLSGGVK
jgi:hypothetical protein